MRNYIPTQLLEELATITMGQSPEAATINSNEKGLPFLQGCAEFGSRHPAARLHCSLPLRVAKAGSTLISVRAPVGRTNRAEQDYCIGRGLSAVLAKPGEADDVFLLSAIEHGVGYLQRRSQGSTFLAISSDDLRSMPIPSPGIDVQRWIAELVSTVDDVIAGTDSQIAKTQQIKAGLMHDLFTCGVTSEGQVRPLREEAPKLYKESPLGWIPKEWESERLDDIAQRGSGHTPNKNHPEYWNGGVKWVSLADSWRLDRVHISETDHEISQLGIDNSSAVRHPAGIVILSRDAGVGKSAITTCEMAISQHFMCWKCGSALDNYYLYYWLQHRKWEFENIATGSTIPTIGLSYFKKYRINIPREASEQIAISRTLLAVDEKIFALEDELRKLRQTKIGLLRDLLTGRVRVPLNETQRLVVNV